MNQEKVNKTIGKVYLHVSNSGASFFVKDLGYGPCIEIHTAAFGNLDHTLKIHATKEGLLKLSELFAQAAKEEYSEDYCNSAEYSAHTSSKL